MRKDEVHPDFPKDYKKMLRASNFEGSVIETHPELPNSTRVTTIVLFDMGGNIPPHVVKRVSGTLPKITKDLIKCVKDNCK